MTTSRKFTPAEALAITQEELAFYPPVPWSSLSGKERRYWRARAKTELMSLRARGFELVPKPAAKARRKGKR